MPIMGKGDPIIIYEDSDEEYNEYMRKKSKKKGDDSKGETQPRYSRDIAEISRDHGQTTTPRAEGGATASAFGRSLP